MNINCTRSLTKLAPRIVAATLFLVFAACNHVSENSRPVPTPKGDRDQLSIGYTLLFQEADNIPKLKWILMFKDKPQDMGRLISELAGYYQHLADTMQRLSHQYPAMRIDVTAMSKIETDERKAIGEDMAKDFAPLVGKTGRDFEREALLMFYDSLNEQRHLVEVMLKLETDDGLRRFLDSTNAQLQAKYAEVGTLLNQRYFTH